MMANRKQIRAWREGIKTNDTFGQTIKGGPWNLVEEITVVGGIIWIRIQGSNGKYMAWEVRSCTDTNVVAEPQKA